MQRLALLNMLIGFTVLTLVAAAGSFIATDLTEGFLKDRAILDSWQLLLMRSSHGHTNLFALIHIAFGLTMPYSAWSMRMKLWQTIGLALGTFAMGPLLLARAYVGPAEGLDVLDAFLGGALSLALIALASHAAGLGRKLMARA